MKVEIWSDFICYNSYLCRKNLLRALDQFPHREQVFIEFKSYPLATRTKRLVEHPLSQSKDQQKHFLIENPLDTLVAHRLVQLAKRKHQACQFVDQVFHAYFVEKKRIDQRHTITTIAYNSGLNQADIEAIVSTNKYKRYVDLDVDEAIQMGIDAPPFIVVNEEFALPNKCSAEQYLQLLTDLWLENKNKLDKRWDCSNSETTFCTGDHCE